MTILKNTDNRYPTAPLKCWTKAKELRQKYFENYRDADKLGGIRFAGSAASFEPIPLSFGVDAYPLIGEAYGASVAFDKKFSAKTHAAAEEAGYPRDLCAYLRNYWGSKVLNEYHLGGPFPKPDFYWSNHMCCSHAKWYQEAAKIEGKNTPTFVTDISIGPAWKMNKDTGEYYFEPNKDGLQYVVDELNIHIEKLEKLLCRKLQDDLLIKHTEIYLENLSLWTQICYLNKAVPAPLDEKSMFSLYVFCVMNKGSEEFRNFYRELLAEVQDRVDRGIAAVGNERARVMSDIQPPWGFLDIFRYMEKHGVVSVGSMYSFALMCTWDIDDNGMMVPTKTPKEKGIEIKTREQALWLLAESPQQNFWANNFYTHGVKAYVMEKIYQQWQAQGIIIHYNRGCEGLSLNVAEQRLAMAEKGIPVVSYEGNMADAREFDIVETRSRIDTFLETLGLK